MSTARGLKVIKKQWGRGKGGKKGKEKRRGKRWDKKGGKGRGQDPQIFWRRSAPVAAAGE